MPRNIIIKLFLAVLGLNSGLHAFYYYYYYYCAGWEYIVAFTEVLTMYHTVPPALLALLF
jgi:hypothetical protein